MKQALLRKGKVTIEDTPAPPLEPGRVLVELTRSLISIGTEMASVQSFDSSMLRKARNKPGATRKAFESISVRGLMKTLAHVQEQLDESSPLVGAGQ